MNINDLFENIANIFNQFADEIKKGVKSPFDLSC
jgi:hypothetical protein